jgi:hypothetical protein
MTAGVVIFILNAMSAPTLDSIDPFSHKELQLMGHGHPVRLKKVNCLNAYFLQEWKMK